MPDNVATWQSAQFILTALFEILNTYPVRASRRGREQVQNRPVIERIAAIIGTSVDVSTCCYDYSIDGKTEYLELIFTGEGPRRCVAHVTIVARVEVDDLRLKRSRVREIEVRPVSARNAPRFREPDTSQTVDLLSRAIAWLAFRLDQTPILRAKVRRVDALPLVARNRRLN